MRRDLLFVFAVQYFSLLLIAFIGVVAGVALAGIFHGKITNSLHGIMEVSLHKYDNDTGCQEAVDFMQSRVSRCSLTYLIHGVRKKTHPLNMPK